MDKFIVVEIGHASWNGQYALDQYLPVDSVNTGIATAKEAIKEYDEPNITIEHPREHVWIIREPLPSGAEFIRSVQVKEVPIVTMETLKQFLAKGMFE